MDQTCGSENGGESGPFEGITMGQTRTFRAKTGNVGISVRTESLERWWTFEVCFKSEVGLDSDGTKHLSHVITHSLLCFSTDADNDCKYF